MCKPVIQNGFSDHFPDHHDGHRGRLGRQPEQFWRDPWHRPATSLAVWTRTGVNALDEDRRQWAEYGSSLARLAIGSKSEDPNVRAITERTLL